MVMSNADKQRAMLQALQQRFDANPAAPVLLTALELEELGRQIGLTKIEAVGLLVMLTEQGFVAIQRAPSGALYASNNTGFVSASVMGLTDEGKSLLNAPNTTGQG